MLSRIVNKWLDELRFWLEKRAFAASCRKHGVSDFWVRLAFCRLCDLGDEWVVIPTASHLHDAPAFRAKGDGNMVEIETFDGRRWVLNETPAKEVQVCEWRPKVMRLVALEFGTKHATNWHEVYRSGKTFTSAEFLPFIEVLYGPRNRAAA